MQRCLLFAVACLAGLAAGAEDAAIERILVYKTEPIEIDGNLDKPAWKKAVKIPIHYEMLTKVTEPSKDATGSYMVAWDAHYLYIGYDWSSDQPAATFISKDLRGPADNLRPKAEIKEDGKERALFEFFIDLANDGSKFWEVHHNEKNGLGDWFCIRPADEKDSIRNYFDNPGQPVMWIFEYYLRDDKEWKVKTAVRQKTKVVDGKEVYAGYSAELRLTLKGLGAPVARRAKDGSYQLDGLPFRLFAAEFRPGKKPVYFHSCKGLTIGWFHDSFEKGQQFVWTEK